MEQIAKTFLEHGILGTVALGAILFGWRMYRDRIISIQEHQGRIDKLHADHQSEMKALEERYITKAETWMQQYHDLSRAQIELLEANERRYGR